MPFLLAGYRTFQVIERSVMSSEPSTDLTGFPLRLFGFPLLRLSPKREMTASFDLFFACFITGVQNPAHF